MPALCYDIRRFTAPIREDAERSRTGQRHRELMQRLRQEPRLEARRCIVGNAFKLGTRRKGGNGVNDDHINRPRFRKPLADRQRLLAASRLRDDQVMQIDAKPSCAIRIQHVLGIDESRRATRRLSAGNHL